jgi:hypothetical protein
MRFLQRSGFCEQSEWRVTQLAAQSFLQFERPRDQQFDFFA